jgi:hypothetical protein
MRIGPAPPPPPPARTALWKGLVPVAVALVLVVGAVAVGMTLIPPRHKPKNPLEDLGLPVPLSMATADALPGHPTYHKDIRPLVEKYCLRCHSAEKKRGGIILDREKDDTAVLKRRELWEKVGDQLRNREMPPEGAKKPTDDEFDTINKWLDATVFKLDCTGPRDPGRTTLRRLNRAEYDNTIRDLLGVNFSPSRDFPADDVGHGFDNIGDVLSLPPLLMEKYLAAAEQIIEEAWKRPESRKRLMPKSPREAGAMADNLKQFASRAWRRPAKPEEVKRLLALIKAARDGGDSPEVAARLAFQAVLISPHFLFRVEQDRPGVQPVNDWELASRLSYFLWSSMPDETLFKAAEKNELHKPEVLEAQARRMLKDGKARALADNFAVQWLNLRMLPSFSPDPKRFPGVNDRLKDAMLQETVEFFRHVVKEDRSVLDFIDGDYTFVNEALAKHYGLRDVKGNHFRKVSLAGTQRAGVLTHASVLSVTSNPTRTSPVKRGKWVLENILGTPPPPPPPDVPELVDRGELKGSMRQQLEQHRKDSACATCHARMDPLGFGYENFDAVGRWRTKEGRHAIDAAGVLPDGSKFNGPAELRKVLLAKKGQYVRTLVDKMLTYATGRGTVRADRCSIEEIAKGVEKAEYRFSELVLGIVKSEPFLKRRGKEKAK